MKVLIACEYSGITRNAFAKAGFDTTSCDILDSEKPGKHYKGDVLDIINDGWDLMIAHPPCTYLSFVGNAYWNQDGRVKKRLEALEFFRKLYEAPIKYICIENPLGIADYVIRRHDQIIEPYFFGDKEKKRTCLWLKNLPKLVYNLEKNLFCDEINEMPKPKYISKKGEKLYFTEGSKGGHIRSKSFEGIAKAMSEQWGKFVYNNLNIK